MCKKLFDEATKEIALFMSNLGIIREPRLSFFENDGGISERLFLEHSEDPDVLALKNISDEVYLRVAGMHAFGAGAFVAAKEIELKHPVSEFTDEEIESIFSDFDKKDAYELALEKLKIPLGSGNKKVLDRVIVIGIKEAKQIAGEKATEPENLKAFMQVLFNAGTSMYLMKK